MWKYLTAKTPCVLIECGVGWRVPKDSDILNSVTGRPKVVAGIVKGICKAFGVPYDLTPPQPPVDWKKKYEETQMKLDDAIKRLVDIMSKNMDLRDKLKEINILSDI